MRKIWLIFLLFISFISLSSFKFFGDPLDEILEYKIVVSPRKDGTLDMRYYIEWHVLDSVSEGPLTWVKIGVPNKYVDDIRGLSDPIEKIYYYTDSGAYIRIDLDRSYRKGEVVNKEGSDVTAQFIKGAKETLDIAKKLNIKTAILKDGSPSCGVNYIYDGNFSGTIIKGMGVTAQLLKESLIDVISEDELGGIIDGDI